jgi:hypothetical protein
MAVMRRAGASWSDIAAHVGKPAHICQNTFYASGCANQERLTQHAIDRAKKLFSQGYNTAQIAVAVGAPEHVIANSRCYLEA